MTAEYVQDATKDALEQKKQEHMAIYEEYLAKFGQINLSDLTPEEVSKIITEKENASVSADRVAQFLRKEIKI